MIERRQILISSIDWLIAAPVCDFLAANRKKRLRTDKKARGGLCLYFPPYSILPSFLYPQCEEDRKTEELAFGGKGVGR